jgi:hypothetical protein
MTVTTRTCSDFNLRVEARGDDGQWYLLDEPGCCLYFASTDEVSEQLLSLEKRVLGLALEYLMPVRSRLLYRCSAEMNLYTYDSWGRWYAHYSTVPYGEA